MGGDFEERFGGLQYSGGERIAVRVAPSIKSLLLRSFRPLIVDVWNCSFRYTSHYLIGKLGSPP